MCGGWVGKHKTELAIAGALATAAFTGGGSLAALAGLGGADAAAAGAAGVGAADAAAAGGAAAGGAAAAGGTAATAAGEGALLPTAAETAIPAAGAAMPVGTTAGGFAPTAQQAGLLGISQGASQAVPSVSSMVADAGPQASMPELGSPLSNVQPSMSAQVRGAITNAVGGPDNYDTIGKGLNFVDKADKAMQVARAVAGPQPQMPAAAPAQRPQVTSTADLAALGARIYGPNAPPPDLRDPRVLAALRRLQAQGLA